MHVRITSNLSNQESQFVQDKLHEFNEHLTEPRNFSEVKLALRGETNELLGGLIGSIAWGWIHVHVLWVSESLRRKGHGKRLMLEGEEIARKRGCKFAKLHTFDFQAKEFYESLGYKVIGQTKGFPPGHRQFLLSKEL